MNHLFFLYTVEKNLIFRFFNLFFLHLQNLPQLATLIIDSCVHPYVKTLARPLFLEDIDQALLGSVVFCLETLLTSYIIKRVNILVSGLFVF